MRNQLLADACFSLVSANELLCSVFGRCLQQPDTLGNFENEDDEALEQGSGKEGRRQR